MAKKKKSSKKNMFKILMDMLTLALGAIVLGFVALPHINISVSSALGGASRSSSGFDLISFEEGANIGVSIVLLLLVIFASLLIAFSVLKILTDSKVVKNSTVAKVASFGLIVLSLLVAGFAIANCITIPVACADKSFNVGNVLSSGVYAVWGAIIVNAVLGIGSFVASVFTLKK